MIIAFYFRSVRSRVIGFLTLLTSFSSCLVVAKINWTKVFSTNQSYLAEIVGGVLTENEIPHTIINKQISGYGLGEIEIYVPETEALQAYYLVNLNNS